jgi:hypothetical protein
MTDMTAFERRVAGEMVSRASPIRPVDDLAVFDAVIATTQSSNWRFNMFSALKFVAAAAIVSLFGGFLLTGVFTTQQEAEMLPAAVTESPSPITAQMLEDMATEAWNNDDVALLEEVYAPDAIQRGVYFDGTVVLDGRPAIIDAALGNLTMSRLAPVIEMDAPDGELHWIEVVDVVSPGFPGEGTVCSFWARDGQVVRQDCLLPMNCIPGTCTR